jgi:hypothetical protein
MRSNCVPAVFVAITVKLLSVVRITSRRGTVFETIRSADAVDTIWYFADKLCKTG